MVRSVGLKTCAHCATPFEAGTGRGDYCCAGCEYVAALIRREGLEKYYELREGTTLPVRSVPFHTRDLSWLEPWLEAAEAEARKTAKPAMGEWEAQGLSCIGCVWLIEKLFARSPGGRRIELDIQTGALRLEWNVGRWDAIGFARDLQAFGYLVGPPGDRPVGEACRLVLPLGLCGALAMNNMLFTLPFYLGLSPDYEFAPLFKLLAVLFATLSLAVGGPCFFRRAWGALRAGVMHMDLPISLGIVAAYAGSLVGWMLERQGLLYFDFVSTFIFLMLVGRWTQETAVERNRNRLLRINPRPREVSLYASTEARTQEAVPGPVSDLKPGQLFGVKPGGIVPVTSRLFSRQAVLSLEWINGESDPREVMVNHRVPSGAINAGVEELRAVAEERWEESLLARLLASVARSGEFRHEALERILRWYVGVVVGVAFLGGIGWWMAGQGATGAQVFISLLVISCPCAIGVSAPLANEIATARLRSEGVFVRDANLWGRLGRVLRLAFDKTGTLTLEMLEWTNPEALETLDADAKAALWKMVETNLHPIGRTLREAMLADGYFPTDSLADGILKMVPGQGVMFSSSIGEEWFLGKLPERQGTVLKRGENVLAEFHFREAVRPDAAMAVAELERRGWPVYVLSGDRRDKVSAMLEALGLGQDRGIAAMTPEAKAAWIRQTEGGRVLMIGDGANDALAFDAAVCRGTPVVDKGMLEHKADFYFLGRSLRGILRLMDVAADRRRAVRAAFALAVAYNIGAAGVCLAGWMNPLVAAIAMPINSLVSVAVVMTLSHAPRPKERKNEEVPRQGLEPWT